MKGASKNMEESQQNEMKIINGNRKKINLSSLRDYGIVLSIVIIFILLSIASPVFLSLQNLLNIIDQSSIVGIIAAGGTMVLIAGGLDLSTAAIYALTGVVVAKLVPSVGVIPAMVIALIMSMLFGLINGTLSTSGRINPIIATLATNIMFRGIAVAITRGFLVQVKEPAFSFLGRGGIGPVKYSSIIFIVAIIIVWFILDRTVFGRYLYSAGGNAVAARLSGVRVNRVKAITFVLSGLAAGIAGLIIASRVSTGQADGGQGLEISAIAAIVIGGTSVSGGEGTAWRTFLGVILLTLIGNGFNLLNVNPIFQQAFTGGIILLAVAIDAWSRKKVSQ
jgi:ribose transport system permease protein